MLKKPAVVIHNSGWQQKYHDKNKKGKNGGRQQRRNRGTNNSGSHANGNMAPLLILMVGPNFSRRGSHISSNLGGGLPGLFFHVLIQHIHGHQGPIHHLNGQPVLACLGVLLKLPLLLAQLPWVMVRHLTRLWIKLFSFFFFFGKSK